MLTLITATLNAGRYIEQALASVPKHPEAIHQIVVDGGSSDGTVDICKKFPWVETVVVPNCSIYEAWNIGIERARGAWVMFLNADDELGEGDCLKKVSPYAFSKKISLRSDRVHLAICSLL